MFINNFRLDELAVMAAKSVGFDGEISAEFRHFETAKALYEKHHDYLRIELADYLQVLKEEGFFNAKDPMVLSMEVTLAPGEDDEIVLANTKRCLNRAWALVED